MFLQLHVLHAVTDAGSDFAMHNFQSDNTVVCRHRHMRGQSAGLESSRTIR